MADKKVATGDWIGGEFVHQSWQTGVDRAVDPDGVPFGGGGGGWVDDGAVVRLDTIGDFVGIGTVTPIEKLHVAGAIVIGDYTALTPAAGTIRYAGGTSPGAFKGWDGVDWINLDESGGGGSGSLDDAYDLGRTITVDAGPMVLTSTSAQGLQINQSVAGNAVEIAQSAAGYAMDIACTGSGVNGIKIAVDDNSGCLYGELNDNGVLFAGVAKTSTRTVIPMAMLALDTGVTYTGFPIGLHINFTPGTITGPAATGIFLSGKPATGGLSSAITIDDQWNFGIICGSSTTISDNKTAFFGTSRWVGITYTPLSSPLHDIWNFSGVSRSGKTAQYNFVTGESTADNSGSIVFYTGNASTGGSGRFSAATGSGSVSGEMEFITGTGSYAPFGLEDLTTGFIRLETGASTAGVSTSKALTGRIELRTGFNPYWYSGPIRLVTGDVTPGSTFPYPETGEITLTTGDGSNAHSGNIKLTTGTATGTGVRGAIGIIGREVFIGGYDTATGNTTMRFATAFGVTSGPRIGTGSAAPTVGLNPPNSNGYPDGSLFIQTGAGGALWQARSNVWVSI